MSRRSPCQIDLDDLAFPTRAKSTARPHGLGSVRADALCSLQEEVGPGGCARTFGADAVAFHVRRPEDLVLFLEAFPRLERAGGTISRAYSSPMRAAPR